MKKKLLCLLLGLMACCLLCGCSLRFFDVEQLMRPPYATGDKEALHRLLENSTGKLDLIYPSSGEYRSAIISVPFAGDGTSGAIAFCANEDSGTTLYFALQGAEDDWSILDTVSNAAARVDRVCFADLNDDGAQEVIVSWGSVQTISSQLGVYSYDQGHITEYLLTRSFGEFAVTDLDADGKDELFIAELYQEPAEKTDVQADPQCLALSYRLDRTGLYIAKTVNLDATVRRYSQLVISDMSFGSHGEGTAVVLDGIRSDGTAVTQLVYIDPKSQALAAPFSAPSNPTARSTTANVAARDIDGDGAYELPVVRVMPMPAEMTLQSVSYIVSWQKYIYGGSTTSTAATTIVNAADGYLFMVPEEWLADTVTCQYDTANGTLSFYAVNNTDGVVTLGAVLLRLRRYSKIEWDSLNDHETYAVAYTQNNIIFAASFPSPNDPLALSLPKIAYRILPISE